MHLTTRTACKMILKVGWVEIGSMWWTRHAHNLSKIGWHEAINKRVDRRMNKGKQKTANPNWVCCLSEGN